MPARLLHVRQCADQPLPPGPVKLGRLELQLLDALEVAMDGLDSGYYFGFGHVSIIIDVPGRRTCISASSAAFCAAIRTQTCLGGGPKGAARGEPMALVAASEGQPLTLPYFGT